MVTNFEDKLIPSLPLSVVVPVYNEERTLALVVHKLLRIPHLLEIIIVDDGSTDATAEIASSLTASHKQVRFQRLEKKSGKTAGLKGGFKLKRGEGVLGQDADLQYDPHEIAEV